MPKLREALYGMQTQQGARFSDLVLPSKMVGVHVTFVKKDLQLEDNKFGPSRVTLPVRRASWPTSFPEFSGAVLPKPNAKFTGKYTRDLRGKLSIIYICVSLTYVRV